VYRISSFGPNKGYTVQALRHNRRAFWAAQRKALLQARYAGWIIPQLIDSISTPIPIYLDGDAAPCLSLILGQGAATAIDRASILAEELSQTADHRTAFAAYARRVRPFVADKQCKAMRFARTFVSDSRLGVQASYLTMKRKFMPLLARLIGTQFGADAAGCVASPAHCADHQEVRGQCTSWSNRYWTPRVE
jgi:hypothetical protein